MKDTKIVKKSKKATNMGREKVEEAIWITEIPTFTTEKEKTLANKESLVETSFKEYVGLEITVGMITLIFVNPGKN